MPCVPTFMQRAADPKAAIFFDTCSRKQKAPKTDRLTHDLILQNSTKAHNAYTQRRQGLQSQTLQMRGRARVQDCFRDACFSGTFPSCLFVSASRKSHLFTSHRLIWHRHSYAPRSCWTNSGMKHNSALLPCWNFIYESSWSDLLISEKCSDGPRRIFLTWGCMA